MTPPYPAAASTAVEAVALVEGDGLTSCLRRDGAPRKVYPSKLAVKIAHRYAAWRLHIYYCDVCRGWHSSPQERA